MAANQPPVVDRFVVPTTGNDGVAYGVEFAAHGGNSRSVTAHATATDAVNGEVTTLTAVTLVGNAVTTVVTVEDPLGQATISQVDATHWQINP